MRVASVALLAAFALDVAAIGAQSLGRPPKRARAGMVADTNDALAWAEWAKPMLTKDAAAAADAFYWAARLDPLRGEHIYGYAMASIASSPNTLRTYMRFRRGSNNKDLRRIDSLLFRAHVIDPFLYRRFDRDLFMEYLLSEATRGNADVSRPELDYYLTNYLNGADADTRAWMAYANGDFRGALKLYADAIKQARIKSPVRVDRGRIFARLGEADSAIAEFDQALTDLRAREAKEVVFLYNSKAVIEHSIAVLREQTDDLNGAREAYGRALQEDLSYHPAHTRLGMLALAAKDSTTAISELELATQIAPEEAMPRFMLANALSQFGQTDRAIKEFEKVVELEPYWATPWAGLAQLYERKAEGQRALDAYNGFFARAARNNPLAPAMKERLANLKEYLGIKP